MRLFLAGTEHINTFKVVIIAEHPYALLSFYYLNKNNELNNWLNLYNKYKDQMDFIIDSGLFTMMFGAASNRKYTEEELDRYTDNYLSTINGIKYNHYIVEMDVHKVLGLESLAKFRTKFENNYDLNKTIYVWHVEETFDGFKKLCKRYPYIALSIPELRILSKNKRQLKIMVKHLIKTANEINKNIKIHLLGNTQKDLMTFPGYFSCDSTSWMTAGTYATINVYEKNTKKQCSTYSKNYKNIYSKYKEKIETNLGKIELKFGTDLTKTKSRTKYHTNLILSAIQYNILNNEINRKFYNNEPINKVLI